MAHYHSDWEDIGRNIEEMIDRAVNSRDYQKLNQNIRQTVERAVDLGSEAIRKAVSSTEQSGSSGKVKKTRNTERPAARPAPRPVLYARTGGKMAAGIGMIVGGSILSAFSFMMLVSHVVFGLLLSGTGVLTAGALLTLAGMGTGVGLLVSGAKTVARINRFQAYRRTLGAKTHCALEKLAQSVGKTEKYVRRELRKMIDQGLFLEGHMDKEETCLITSHETFRYFEQSRLALEERQKQAAAEKARQAAQPEDPALREILEKGEAFLCAIRDCNDRIPGVQISEKISRMELIIQRIFARAASDPGVAPDLKKMMQYYLPMTVKLLNAYAEMDAQPVQGQTIRESKQEIEQTLDTLNQAFEKLLDDLFVEKAMDISSDISVLHTLLAQEGLTEDDLSKMKNQM